MTLKRSDFKSGYFEAYGRCGCASEIVRRKKDLLGYCAKHGSDRSEVVKLTMTALPTLPAPPTVAQMQAEIDRCNEEIARCKADIATDIGALIGAADWENEKAILEGEW